MRFTTVWFLALSVLGLGLTACGDPNAGALFADIQYGTGCMDSRGCTPQPNRDICGINLGDPCPEVGGVANLSCSVVEAPDQSSRTLTFSASQGGDFSVSLRQAIFAFDGGPAGGTNCNVTVVDGPNRHTGQCGSAAPTEMTPCQVTNVRFYDDVGNPTVEGDFACRYLQSRSNPLQLLDVHAKGSTAAALMAPGHFRIANCDGLEIPDP